MKLSIIMPVYNEKTEWVLESIKSIKDQSFQEFEFIIVLDNPENRILAKLLEDEARKDSRIIILKNSKNLGIVKSLNLALSKAKGEYIARMDADDIAIYNRIETQLKFLENNRDVSLVGTNWKVINEENQILFEHGTLPTNFEFIKKNIQYNNMFLHPSWMFRRNVIEKIGYYREIQYCEDYDFITRLISSNMKITNINEYLMLYRVRNSSISLTKGYEQFLNSNKAIEYMKERLKLKKDSFNDEFILIDENKKERYLEASRLFIESRNDLHNKKYFFFIYKFLKSFLISKHRCNKNFKIIKYNLNLFLYQIGRNE